MVQIIFENMHIKSVYRKTWKILLLFCFNKSFSLWYCEKWEQKVPPPPTTKNQLFLVRNKVLSLSIMPFRRKIIVFVCFPLVFSAYILSYIWLLNQFSPNYFSLQYSISPKFNYPFVCKIKSKSFHLDISGYQKSGMELNF